MIAKYTEFEQRYFGNAAPAVPASPLVALADRFMWKLNDAGPMSREELVDMALKEGFFPDAERAVQGVHSYAHEFIAKRANSRVARRKVRATHYLWWCSHGAPRAGAYRGFSC